MNLVKKYFSKQDLDTVTAAIRRVEMGTSGEVRVEIRQRRGRNEGSMSIEQIARREFIRLGMTNTSDRTGVLIFLLLEDKQFCILADEGIHAKVGQDPWTNIAEKMARALKDGAFVKGVVDTVTGIGDILRKHVPRRPDDSNELPDIVGTR